VHRLHAHLGGVPDGSLALVEIGSAEPAAISLAALAYRLASEGKRVVLADAAEDRPLRALLRAKGDSGAPQTVSLRGQQISLVVAAPDPTRMADPSVTEDADVTLVLATVDSAVGADHLAASVGKAVVMIRAGEATRSSIEAIATQLRHARIAILSGILIGTDREDYSSGLPAAVRGTSAEPGDGLFEVLKASGQ